MGEEGWQLRLHRQTGVGSGADCGQCTQPSYSGVTGDCTDTTTATYIVQCTVEGTVITMVFDVTGVTNVEIGQWTCNPTVGVSPEVDITIAKFGKKWFCSAVNALLIHNKHMLYRYNKCHVPL